MNILSKIIILFFIFVSIFTCRKGPSISKEEVQKLRRIISLDFVLVPVVI
ncbi:hypothetical protein LEP1GSC085_2319 [Leptospira interrogans str. L0996]|nr:hypothetical protein LEP1GSC085_2319 [Leptospira interrogans str. L0996]